MNDETAPATGDALWLRLAAVLVVVLAVTGLGLLFAYQPGPGAVRSLIDLRETSRFAALRDLHRPGAARRRLSGPHPGVRAR